MKLLLGITRVLRSRIALNSEIRLLTIQRNEYLNAATYWRARARELAARLSDSQDSEVPTQDSMSDEAEGVLNGGK